MAVPIQIEFVLNFHSLNGITIGERRKSLFLLLDKTFQSLKTMKGEIDFTFVVPRTPLEENFKVDALIYFRKSAELLDVLKSENPVLIRRILNVGPWFVQESFGKISGEELTTEIFPCLSYNTKVRLLNKFAVCLNDETKCDEYFQIIRKTYGVHLASKLLPACSADLIMNCIESNRIEIPPRQLLMIIKKFPALTEDILEKLNQKHGSKISFGKKYKYVFTYFANGDVRLFVRLKEKYKVDLKLGSRATNKFIYGLKQDVIQNPLKFYPILKRKRIGKVLRGDFGDFYRNFFPKQVGRLFKDLDDHLRLLHFLPSDAQKLKILLATFRAIHGSELWDHEIFMKSQLIKMMSPEDRENWLQTHTRPKVIPEETWISFMKTEKSISLLKEKIALTSKLQQRAALVHFLPYTCKVNNDKMGLLDVCRYMVDNHLHDHLTVRRSFITSLNNSLDLTQLEDEHWKYINQFMCIFQANNETCSICEHIFEKYICYCVEKNRPVKEYLEKLVKKKRYRFNIGEKSPKCEKHCLLMFSEIIPRAYEGFQLDLHLVMFLNSLLRWNKRHPEDQISLFLNDRAISSLATLLTNRKTNIYFLLFIVEKCLLLNFQKCEEANVPRAFLENFSQIKVMEWFIRNHPLFVLNHADVIIKNFVKIKSVPKLFRNLLRLYTHLQIPQKMSQICLNIIKKKEEDFTGKRTATIIFSYLTNPEEFLSVAASHCPMDGKNTVLPCLKNINPPSLVLEWTLNHCKGRNCRFAQNVISEKVSEEKLSGYLKILNNRAVTFRKPTVFLDFRALKLAEIYDIVNKSIEKNYQIPFRRILKFFVNNSNDSSWKLVQQDFATLNTAMENSIAILTDCKRIPLEYFLYVLPNWDILEKSKCNSLMQKGKCNILNLITPTIIPILPKKFCVDLIQKYLFKTEKLTDFQKKIQTFACRSIIYASSQPEQENLLRFVMEILKEYVRSTWYDVNAGVIGRKLINNFIKEFCSDFLNENHPPKEILQAFIASWNDYFKPYDAFDEYLYLYFSFLYVDCLNDGNVVLEKVGEKLAFLCDALNEQNCFAIGIVCEIFDSFKKHFYSVDLEDSWLVIIENIIKTSDSSYCLILAASLLPVGVLVSPEVTFRKILLQRTDAVVQTRLHHLLTQKMRRY